MANIQEYLNKILLARYGKEVRGSIHDAIQAMNTQVEDSETSAGRSAIEAATKASEASAYAEQASTSANNAANSANQSESYATGDTGSAKYYYEQARTIIESLSGALRPMGTVPFANLPDVTIAVEGDMYNISDEFTTTSDFKEGSGVTVAAGSNVYKTTDGHWDVLAGSPVTGIKGDKESSYRRGNVNITTENIGAVSIGGDIADNIVTFTSDDCGPNGDPALLEIPKLTTGEKLSSLMQKVSRIANNFRYFLKMLGTTDISAIGDGTVTGGISTLNDNLNNYLPLSGGTITGSISGKGGGVFAYDGNVYLKCDGYDGWLSTIIHYKTDIGYPSISFVEKYSYSGQFFAENSKVIINGRFIYDGIFLAHNWYVIGYIQDGYRPSPGFQIHASAGVISNDSVNIGSALICIKEDGSINYYSEIPGFCIDTSITFKV